MFAPLSIGEFRSRTSISQGDLFNSWSRVQEVASLRDIMVEDLRVMPLEYLKQLLTNVTLAGDESRRPYAHAVITTMRMDPYQLQIPQTFIQRSKYQAFLENFSSVFNGFCVTKGVAKCTALIALGRTKSGAQAIAHYIPPMVEIHAKPCLIDGMHRNFLVMTVGTTLETIVIENVSDPYPCTPQTWSRVSVVQEKPPQDERFFDLKPHLFRDLKWVGIDG